VVLAVPRAAVASAVSGVQWAGRTVIDGTNPLLFPDLTPARWAAAHQARSSPASFPAHRSPRPPVTFRPSSSIRIRSFRRPTRTFVPGDNAPAKQAIIDLFNAAGFYPIDLGDLVSGGRMQQFGGPLAGRNLLQGAT